MIINRPATRPMMQLFLIFCWASRASRQTNSRSIELNYNPTCHIFELRDAIIRLSIRR